MGTALRIPWYLSRSYSDAHWDATVYRPLPIAWATWVYAWAFRFLKFPRMRHLLGAWLFGRRWPWNRKQDTSTGA